ncbi:hypothetical protein CRENBAI_000438 [Crenichthys baileyi]|uniref:Secreted protein n=1 Tax=Crenichthys baileyi TaxID=28760 RepID=A0AAV9R222_9TELE
MAFLSAVGGGGRFSLSPAPSHICPALALCLVFLFGASFWNLFFQNSELSAVLLMQLIKFSRLEDRVKGNPLVQTGHFSPDTRWTPGRSVGLCVCRYCQSRMSKMCPAKDNV